MAGALSRLADLPRTVSAAAVRGHPIEVVGLGTLIVCCAMVVVFDLRWYFPDGHSALFATEHYVLPLVLALGLAWLGRLLKKARGTRSSNAHALRLIAWFSFIIYLHFNLKLWAGLMNHARWDDLYLASDEALWPIVEGLRYSYDAYWGKLVAYWPLAYHDVFVGMFVVSLAAHATLDRSVDGLSKVATTVAIVLALGGLSYAIAPAWGPFVFGPGANPVATGIQEQMMGFQRPFVESAGAVYRNENFIMALAAMPSLHVAHAFVLLFYAWRRLPWLGYAYVLPFLFIVTEAIVAKWHYVVDLPVGLLVALASIWLSDRLHRWAKENK